MIRTFDSLIRSNLTLYSFLRRRAVFLCRFFLLEEGFSFLRQISPIGNSVAIDVGSNDGTSMTMIRKIHPKIPIHTFDPIVVPKNLPDRVSFHQIALSDQSSKLPLHIPTIGNETLTQYASSDQKKILTQLVGDFGISPRDVHFEYVESQSERLDSLQLSPYFIKVDVEGHELEVIRGSIETIQTFKPILLIELQSLENYQQMRNLLQSMNYFNLEWPSKGREKDFHQEGLYSRKRNNYVWLPRDQSETWKFEKP
jgi:FkbM family methyltransferase